MNNPKIHFKTYEASRKERAKKEEKKNNNENEQLTITCVTTLLEQGLFYRVAPLYPYSLRRQEPKPSHVLMLSYVCLLEEHLHINIII